ncbi:MAG: leucine/isoleucine/valine transporter permease subunit [Chloroflexota bacterium]|nr:leucine/isoleucine/valine transporter permease subunit [Chloroflexota bacterium]
MTYKKTVKLQDAIKFGLLAGLISLSLSIIGFITLLGERELIAGVLTSGHIFLFAAPMVMAYITAGRAQLDSKGKALGYGLVIGLITAIPLIILAILATFFDIRQFLVNVSPELIAILTFGQELAIGSVVLLASTGIIATLAAGLRVLSKKIRHPIISALGWTFLAGTFSAILWERLRSFFGRGLTKLIFSGQSLKLVSVVIFFVIVGGITVWWDRRGHRIKERIDALPAVQQQSLQRAKIGAGIVLLLILPILLGTYLSEVANNIGLYILMGLGLNIVVGFAGLLDLGYVAFFAIGAYIMGVLTSEGSLGLGLTFWTALPFSVIGSTLAGIVLGIPVLGMRGDYLAIVTLGFGEIIRILALSDMLKSYIGGAQGILQIPKPRILGFDLVKPEYVYYIIFVGVLLAAYVSWRLRDSRLGRQWMAMREDEDVAEAMGINLVNTKLLAFATGAAFSGLSGAIFASKLTSIFPHSFNLIISINVLCLIIVGGVGSLPGVAIGALILVGLPELLREFAEHRMLIYGALLVVMMLAKPEGFLPSEISKRELHAHEDQDLASSD